MARAARSDGSLPHPLPLLREGSSPSVGASPAWPWTDGDVLPGHWVKRTLDVTVALSCLIVLLPLMLLIGLAVKLSDAGPILFRWEILGRGARPIRSYKFRTMVPDAEGLEGTLRAQGHNEMTSVMFKMRHDPRVTPVGKILRKFSLDELPSLWSVVKGDMSLVGPRPVLVAYGPHLKDWHYSRFAMRPGLTSPWITNGKGHVKDFDAIAASDLEYIRAWSFRRDLVILYATAAYVFSGSNY